MSWLFDSAPIVAAIAWLDGYGPTESQIDRNAQMEQFWAARAQQAVQQPIRATVTVIEPLRLEYKP